MSVDVRNECLQFLRDFVKAVDAEQIGEDATWERVLSAKIQQLFLLHKDLLERVKFTANVVMREMGFTLPGKESLDNPFQNTMLLINNVLEVLNTELVKLGEAHAEVLKKWKQEQGVQPSEAAAPPLGEDALSIQDKTLLSSVAQFVLVFGYYPYLVPGAGLDLRWRMKAGKGLELATKIRDSPSIKQLSPHAKYISLRNNAVSAHLYLRHPDVAVPMIKTLGIDLLAAFLQLLYLPLLEPVPVSEGSGGGRQRQVRVWPPWNEERRLIEEIFVKFTDGLYQPELVRQYMVLMSVYVKGPKGTKDPKVNPPPAFIQRGCIAELQRCLMKKHGVRSVVTAILDDPHPMEEKGAVGGAEMVQEERKLGLVVSLILNPMKRPGADVEGHLKQIGPQLVHLLDATHADNSSQNRLFASVVVQVLMAAAQDGPNVFSLASKYIIKPICNHLESMCVSQPLEVDERQLKAANGIVMEFISEPYSRGFEKVSSEELQSTLERLEKLMLNADRWKATPVMLLPIYQPLFCLHKSVHYSVSWLKSGVEKLVVHMVRNAPKNLAISLLLAPIINSAIVFKPQNGPVSCSLPVDRLVQFRLTDSGSVEALKLDDETSLPSFEETVDDNIELALRLLYEIVKDDNLTLAFIGQCIELFLTLMRMDRAEDGKDEKVFLRYPCLKEEKVQFAVVQLFASVIERPDTADVLSSKPMVAAKMLEPVFADAAESAKGPSPVGKFDESGFLTTATVKSCLAAYYGLMIGFDVEDDEFWDARKPSVKDLNALSDHHQDEDVKGLAKLCASAIQSRGLVDLTKTVEQFASMFGKEEREKKDVEKKKSAKKKLIEELPDKMEAEPSERRRFVEELPDKRKEEPSERRRLVEELSDGMDEVSLVKKPVAAASSGLSKMPLEENGLRSEMEVEPADESTQEQLEEEDEEFFDEGTKSDRRSEVLKKVTYKGALALAKNPEPAFRAAGLLQFAKLLDRKDAEIVENRQDVLKIIQDCLQDDDSYVYEMAIRALVAMAIFAPDECLDKLAEEFTGRADASSESSVELRLKAGEALTRAVRHLGELCYHHRTRILNPVFSCARDPDELIRASAVSCLAELCEVVGYRLESNINEVLSCLEGLMQDSAIEVQRATVMLVGKMFKGMGRDALEVLAKELKFIWRALKRLYTTSPDSATRLHAQTAMEEVNDVVRKFITDAITDRPLEKTLYVADAPPGKRL